MPSPFPGMDPWLEAPDLFPSLHGKLIYLIGEALNAAMPDGYAAVGNYLVWVDAERRRDPDVSLFGPYQRPSGGTLTFPGLTAVGTAPARQPRKAPYLEIRADRGQRLVTAVELLSPSNKVKNGPGRKAYRTKQAEFRRAGGNVVEIDLLRRGTHTTTVPLDRMQRLAGRFDYHVCVVLAGDEDDDELFVAPISLPDRLPAIGIPLDPGVPAAVLDLQPLFDRAYDGGRYPMLVRYDQPPDPPLSAEQSAWAAGVLRAKGLLPGTEG
ncbi:MAG: DUF4058 family protein [Fimbriiglobus sp.]